MYLKQNQIISILDKDFMIDFFEVVLTQQKIDNPIIYHGPGSLILKDDGFYYLKVYFKSSEKLDITFGWQNNTTPGKIIGKDNYFTLEAIDTNGYEWKAEDISISEDVCLNVSGVIINTKIYKLERNFSINDERLENHDCMHIIVPGKYKLPCNKSTDLANGGWKLNRCVIDTSSYKVEITKEEKFIEIEAESKENNVRDNFDKIILETLSILLGKTLLPIFKIRSKGISAKSTLYSYDYAQPNKGIITPVPSIGPHNYHSFSDFFKNFINSSINSDDVLFGYWLKIHRSWQAGIENAALTVSVSIEGVIKNYFLDHIKTDEKFIHELTSAKKQIKALKLPERIATRILSSLGSAPKPTPKGVLFALVEDGFLNKKCVQSWISLRNKSAHADTTEYDPEKVQKYLDDIFSCMHIFYTLMLKHIEYSGKYNNHSISNWPVEVTKHHNETDV